jgi:hypothetical protein
MYNAIMHDPGCSTRPALPVSQRVEAHHWITDETAAEARRLWQQNTHASQIECALIVATRHIQPLVALLKDASRGS